VNDISTKDPLRVQNQPQMKVTPVREGRSESKRLWIEGGVCCQFYVMFAVSFM